MTRLLIFCLLLLCGLLQSCVFVSTAEVLDNVGHQCPAIKMRQNDAGLPLQAKYQPEELTLWKKGNLYYVELSVVYVPKKNCLIYLGLPRNGIVGTSSLSEAEHYASQSEPQTYYAELTEAQWRMLFPAENEVFDYHAFHMENIRLLRADEVDMRGARKQKSEVPTFARQLLYWLPDKRTLGNQLRRPITWALFVAADIPLSVGATAVSWTVMVLLEPFSS